MGYHKLGFFFFFLLFNNINFGTSMMRIPVAFHRSFLYFFLSSNILRYEFVYYFFIQVRMRCNMSVKFIGKEKNIINMLDVSGRKTSPQESCFQYHLTLKT